jgi:hypothetical protein
MGKGRKGEAAGALRNLAGSAENKVPIAQAGGVEALVLLVRDGDAKGKAAAAAALRFLQRR